MNEQLPYEDEEETARALRALPKERPVDPKQEAAVIAALETPPRRWMRPLAVAATVAVAFLGGRMTAPSAPREEPPPQYMLMVRGDQRPSADPVGTHKEYARWAKALAEQGRLTTGEELGDDRIVLSPADPSVQRISARQTRSATGYFLLTSSTEAEALSIARDCPHLRRGGSVELRKIVRR
jgi:hypothetical protein